jgi:geranylgeranyl reductase family protein
MVKYDVVIIGAGPAGLNCANHLQGSNKSVLLIEKNNEIGPKVCAGGFLNRSVDYLKIPEYLIQRSFDKMTVSSFLGKKTICVEKKFVFTVSRKELGEWFLEKVTDKNHLTIRTGCYPTEIQKDKLILSDGETISFDYLVGADGSNSIVRKYLGIKTEKILLAMQYIVPGIYDQLEFIYRYKIFGCLYGWIFPYKDNFSIGFGCDPRNFSVEKLKNNFEKWMDKIGINYKSGQFQAFTINNDYQGFEFSNIFLAGDAAGLASPLTGEGIHEALVSGEVVAKKITDQNYKSEEIDKIIKRNKIHARLAILLRITGPISDIIFELIATALKNKKIAKKMLGKL